MDKGIIDSIKKLCKYNIVIDFKLDIEDENIVIYTMFDDEYDDIAYWIKQRAKQIYNIQYEIDDYDVYLKMYNAKNKPSRIIKSELLGMIGYEAQLPLVATLKNYRCNTTRRTISVCLSDAAEILFNREGNELKTLTLPVLMVALENIDRFLDEKIEDSEKLDWSLFVVSTEMLQSIVSDAEFTLDGMASEVRLIELPKEEIIRAKAKEELLGSYNITNSGVKDSYVKSNMNIIDNTISINVYASQYVIKPIKFNLSNKDIETSIYNTDYTELNVFINADNKEVSLENINYELEKEKKEITDKLVKHLGKLFKSLGITSNIKAKYIAAMMYDTSIQGTKDVKGIHEDLKDKLLNYDDEALAKIVRDKQKEIIADEVIRSINQKEYCITGSNMAYTNENVFRQLTVITLQNIKNKYCIKTEQFGNIKIKATLFIKDFTNDEIIEIINKVKEYYTKIDSNTGAEEVDIRCSINYDIV